jgi:Xaa-Pro dipeptidase
MRKQIVDRQIEAIKENRLDAMISCSPENFTYAAGFVVPTQAMLRHRHAMVIVTEKGDVALFGVDMEATTIGRHEPSTPLQVWAEFTDDAMSVLASQLRSIGLGRARIGIEMDYLPARDFVRLQTFFPEASFVPCERILARLRQIKTPDEIVLLRELSRTADQAITDSLSAVKAGDTEMDIAAIVTRRIYELGAERFRLLIVATGPRSELPNVGPSERKLMRGDVCRVEVFAEKSGYMAGVCRTAVVQEAPPMAEKLWQHLIDCKYEIMEMVKPGASCLDIYKAFIDRLAKANMPPISFVGHGIGLYLHEDPYLGKTPTLGVPGVDALIEENMVLGFEPLCYQTGFGFGLQNKDMLLVTQNGSELLSDYADTDKLLVVK